MQKTAYAHDKTNILLSVFSNLSFFFYDFDLLHKVSYT